MTQRATVHSVRVRPRRKPDDFQLLGDFDRSGGYVLNAIETLLNEFAHDYSNHQIHAIDQDVDGDRVFTWWDAGESGIDAEIRSPDGPMIHHQLPEQIQTLKCGTLFVLPRDQDLGFVITHSNNGRSVGSEFRKKLAEEFKQQAGDDYVLEFRQIVPGDTFARAIQHDRVKSVRYTRLVKPDSTDEQLLRLWRRAGEAVRIETRLVGHRSVLQNNPLLPLIDHPERAHELLENEGTQFDRLTVDIEMPSGSTRTFNVEDPGSGTTLSMDILEGVEVPGRDDVKRALTMVYGDYRRRR